MALQLSPKNPAAYNNRGVARREEGEVNAAINDFDQAIALDSGYELAYRNRAAAEAQKGDLDSAIADSARAIELDPKDAVAYADRGTAKSKRGDFAGALIDYDRALQLNPKYSGVYVARGTAKRDRGDLDGALVEYNQALQVDPKNTFALRHLGVTKELAGDFNGALSELIRAAELTPPSRFNDYDQFFIWVLRARLNQRDEADTRLGQYLEDRKQPSLEPWIANIGQFLVGKLAESDFISSADATDPDEKLGQLCEAWYYAGMKRLLSGDKQGGLDDLRHCTETKKTGFFEYTLAEAELARS
jgi:lipoprotein NlpI